MSVVDLSIDAAEMDPAREQPVRPNPDSVLTIDGLESVVVTPRQETSYSSDLWAVRRFVRTEEHKNPKDLDGKAKDESIRALIAIHRTIDVTDPSNPDPREERQVNALKQRCASKVLEYAQPTIEIVCRRAGLRHPVALSGAYLGFYKAFERFDPDRGVQFLTFADRYIKGEAMRALRDDTLQQRTYSRRDIDKIKFIDTMLADHASKDKAYAAANTTEKAVKNLDRKINDGYLQPLVWTDDEGTEYEVGKSTSDTEADAMREVVLVEIGQIIDGLKLSKHEEGVVNEYFGFIRNEHGNFISVPDFERSSQLEMADRIGVSQSYVSRIIKKVAQRIRDQYVINNSNLT